jgi:hypothetical protein
MTLQFFQSGAAHANNGETETVKIRSATVFFIVSIVRDRKGTLMLPDLPSNSLRERCRGYVLKSTMTDAGRRIDEDHRNCGKAPHDCGNMEVLVIREGDLRSRDSESIRNT